MKPISWDNFLAKQKALENKGNHLQVALHMANV